MFLWANSTFTGVSDTNHDLEALEEISIILLFAKRDVRLNHPLCNRPAQQDDPDDLKRELSYWTIDSRYCNKLTN